MTRPSWHNYFFSIADMVATRATCPRLQVGAVLVYRNRIIVTGYNGSLPKEAHCLDVGCKLQYCPVHESHCRRTIHAETNILFQLTKPWVKDIPINETTLYVTHQPCPKCKMKLRYAGITRIEWRYPYREDYAVGDCTLVT